MTRINSRNFLRNISYNGVTKEDFFNKNFSFDVYVLITKNINPFFLERKIHEQNSRDLIYMFWNECINDDFYKHICKSKNFICLNGKNVLHPKASETLMEYVEEDEKNYGNIKKNFIENKEIFQYVYTKCYPDVYSSSEERRIKLKSQFLLKFKIGKNPADNEKREEINEFQ